MKTIKYLFFFGGFMLFFNFSSKATNGNQPNPTNQLREQIFSSFSQNFIGSLNQPTESVTVEFVVDPSNRIRVVEMSGGSPALKKLVKEKFEAIEANALLTNDRYSIQLTFNLI